MTRWTDFERAAPEMAAEGRKLLYQHGTGLAYLASVRPDGGPRVHPICPAIVEDGLYAFIGDSPKRRDLLRDGRYALHTFPCKDGDDEFYLTGRVQPREDPDLERRVTDALAALGTTHGEGERLFEFFLERALHAAYGARPSWPPKYTVWKAP
jgi:hypothetical protein